MTYNLLLTAPWSINEFLLACEVISIAIDAQIFHFITAYVLYIEIENRIQIQFS